MLQLYKFLRRRLFSSSKFSSFQSRKLQSETARKFYSGEIVQPDTQSGLSYRHFVRKFVGKFEF